MKLAILVLLSTIPAAHAAQLCGRLGAEIIRPVCYPGQMCPHHLTRQYFVQNTRKTVVETASFEVLQQFGELTGQMICAAGEPSRDHSGAFEVTAIRAR